MPGKYLEYIKAGRYVVPVELSFLQSKLVDNVGQEILTSKWMERRHWKEIKAMLKPAVELVGKYNESGTDKISKSHHISFGQEIAFGYCIHLNKDKCPFVAVLDVKHNSWTDDEDGEIDENSGIADFGGRHKNFTPTKCYIRGCVAKKSGSQVEDGKKIRKELGVKNDDVRNYFQPSPSSSGSATLLSVTNQPGIATYEKPHKTKNRKRNKSTKNKKEHRRRSINSSHIRHVRDYSSSEESLMDLPPPGSSLSWPLAATTPAVKLGSTTGTRDTTVASQLCSPIELPTELDILGSIDVDIDGTTVGGDILSDSVDEVFSSSSLFRNWIEDDDEDFDEELPDIEETGTSIHHHTSRKPKRSAGNRRKFGSDKSKSPAKNTSGLPDIDDTNKRGRAKRKRNVAIVEPMKPMKSTSTGQMSFEEAVGAMSVPAINATERKKRARSTGSPTMDRSRFKNCANSAIEIVGEDTELPNNSDARSHFGSQGSVEKRKRKDVKQARHRRKRRGSSPLNDRLTPSPFPESPEEDFDVRHDDPDEVDDEDDEDSYSGSEPEMPVLVKMVPSSDDDQNNSVMTPPESPGTVPPLEPAEPNMIIPVQQSEKVRRSLSPDIADHCVHSMHTTVHRQLSKHFSISDHSQNLNSYKSSSPIVTRILHHASDSDDITSESAYRKTPIRRKRRKKLVPGSSTTSTFNSADQRIYSKFSRERTSVSPSKQTGDAQTQTTFAVPSILDIGENSHPRDQIAEGSETTPTPSSNVPEKTSAIAVKTERTSQSDSDSDHVREESSSGDEDDDDVLFAGQYFAIPVLTLDSPKRSEEQYEDEDDEELFSFDRPASVKIECQSINSVDHPSNPPEVEQDAVNNDEAMMAEDDGYEYSFDFVARSRNKTHAVSRTGGPQGSDSVVNALSDNPVVVEVQVSSESDNHRNDDECSHQRVENLSTFQLMNHPGTLRAGFGFLNKVMSNNGKRDNIYKRFGLDKREKKKHNEQSSDSSSKQIQKDDSDLMPPPPAKRPASPDICSLNPEQRLKKSKFARSKHRKNNDHHHSLEMNRAGSPQPGPSTGIRASPMTSFDVDDSDDDSDDHYPIGAEPYFREFMSRAQEPQTEYQPRGDEYDLTQASQCMPAVVQDYAEKSRTYKKHTKNIEDMTSDQFKQHFEIIRPQILDIVEGKEESIRNKLYCNKSHQDIRTLKSLNVITPFHEEHGNTLNAWLYDLLLPYSASTLKCADYVNYVTRPEAFIRIYALVNKISRQTAEKEMLAGPCYEGPYKDS